MKAIRINGSIKKYTLIPKAWGKVIGGFDTLTSDVWEAAGFYDVVTPSYDSNTQYLGDIEWDADNSVFTYSVIDRTWSQTVAELKANKIENLKSIYNRKLSETDWYIIRAQEGIAAPQNILDARAALRTECATKEDEINALTTKKAVVSYSINID
ncbi:MAG: hypothetical protein Tp1111SUR761211_8 [Prokaryotic dsDNA virus sp.]|nr:MAG: hypothetical protein Tp1111SUR761211_8 [Prokaryotic dsDNA virus sp.]|tara:strand:- start:4295 stop:4759 length:465 start_codon:yes stop_codon:yes gene_type:complete